MSGEEDVKENLRALFSEAICAIFDSGMTFTRFAGRTALFNSERDDTFTKLTSFERAADSLASWSAIQAIQMPGVGSRVALQFLYNAFRYVDDPQTEAAAFDATWQLLLEELAEPHRRHVGIANLQNFLSDADVLEIADGVTIRSRSFDELPAIAGWNKFHLERLADDWSDGAAGEFVIVSEVRSARTPTDVLMHDLATPWSNAQRVLLALRLLKPGDVGMGRMFYGRPSPFFHETGSSSSGATFWRPGAEYAFTSSEVPAARQMYLLVQRFERVHSEKHPHVDLALRRFTSIYDRLTFQKPDQLVDAMTAFEALLKIGSEISFRLAFRTAGILASNDGERLELFEKMVRYYDARNKIVHGSSLDPQHRDAIKNEVALRNVLRHLLLAFLRLAESGGLTKKFYADLDATLQHSEKRDSLRKTMGLAHA